MWGIAPQKTLLLKVKDEEAQLVQVRFQKNSLAKALNLYRVAQYYFVNFPTVNFLEWHPYSVSSGPDEQSIEIHIKGKDFSSLRKN